jgi:hypothetical protein
MKKRTFLIAILVGLLDFQFLLAGKSVAAETAPCHKTLDACPAHGCAKPGTPDALVNQLKRTMPDPSTARSLTLEDFEVLQDQADTLVGQKKSLSKTARNKLRNLDLRSSNDKVSEGDSVQLTAYIIGLPNRPKASGKESVNCRLTGVRNNDFHIPIAGHPEDTEFEGIVVEMIPQDRPEGWTVRKLRWIAHEKRPVLIQGQLFYDNKHLVNDDPDEEKHGDPKRFSLWEIHPVSKFYVCMKPSKKCDRTDLTDWEPLVTVETSAD